MDCLLKSVVFRPDTPSYLHTHSPFACHLGSSIHLSSLFRFLHKEIHQPHILPYLLSTSMPICRENQVVSKSVRRVLNERPSSYVESEQSEEAKDVCKLNDHDSEALLTDAPVSPIVSVLLQIWSNLYHLNNINFYFLPYTLLISISYRRSFSAL